MVALLVCSLFALPALAADGTTDEHVTDIGAQHDLDSSDAVSEFNSQGHTSTRLTRIDMTATVATQKSEVGLEHKLTPTDAVNDYLRLEYNEEATRTVRILIPKEYWTPYKQEGVESITTDHTATFEPARGGEYTSVVLEFDGPADVVLPAKWYDSMSYKALERVDQRMNKSVGVTLRGDGSQWNYVTADELTSGPGYEIGTHSDQLTVQYDATPDQPEETWINAPQGESMRQDLYYYTRDSENSTSYIVSKTEDPPTVRYKVNATFMDRLRGNIRDIQLIPDRFQDLFDGGDLFG
ncbi:hypothetical protein [Halolamina salina]|uniref:Uncharacterized protein n=1 Tax=Halolamina salina TaxID=1220023 RepID=A0ABD6B5E4_9EURY